VKNKIKNLIIFLILLPIAIVVKLAKIKFIIKFAEISFDNFGGCLAEFANICGENSNLEKSYDKKVYIIFYYKPEIISSTYLIKNLKKSYHISKFYSFYSYLEKVCNRISLDSTDAHSVKKINYVETYDPMSKSKLNFIFSNEEKKNILKLHSELRLPENAKWICVFSRDSNDGYLDHYVEKNKKFINKAKLSAHLNIQKLRDTSLFKMKSALEKFTEYGYYVIVMGKKANMFLTDNEKIIDYSNSSINSEFADIYLLNNCITYYGADSGIHIVPLATQKKVFIAGTPDTYYFWKQFHWMEAPFLPKLLFDNEKKQVIKYRDFLKEGLIRKPPEYSISYEEAGQNRIISKENSEDEYLNLAMEAHKILTGDLDISLEQKKLRKEVKKIFDSLEEKYISKNRYNFISDYFIKKNFDQLI
jgi:putative glycosyltransferase (TIGR04372 family)